MLTAPHTMLPARDLGRFRGFFHDKLGIDPVSEREGMLTYGDGVAAFEVYETDNAGTAKNTQMIWETDDLDAEMRRMRNAGVQFDDFEVPGTTQSEGMKTDNGVVEDDDMRAAWFHDSEGNILCIAQMKRT